MIDLFLQTIAWLLNRLPRPWALGLGRLLGAGLYLCLPYRKDVAWWNLRRAFPECSSRQRRAILRRAYRHFGAMLMDFVRMPELSHEQLASIVDLEETCLEAAREKGHGALLMVGHIGNWELLGRILTWRNYPLISVAVPQRGAGGRYVGATRRSAGYPTIPRKTPARTMLRLLREGNFLGLVGDQDARRSGVWVRFFGQASSRPRGAAVFALKTGAPMLVSSCLPQRNGRYRVEIVPVSTRNLPDDHQQAVQTLIQRYMNILESVVRRHPEQYLWFHRLWKSHPEPAEGTCPEPS